MCWEKYEQRLEDEIPRAEPVEVPSASEEMEALGNEEVEPERELVEA